MCITVRIELTVMVRITMNTKQGTIHDRPEQNNTGALRRGVVVNPPSKPNSVSLVTVSASKFTTC